MFFIIASPSVMNFGPNRSPTGPLLKRIIYFNIILKLLQDIYILQVTAFKDKIKKVKDLSKKT